MKNKQDKSTPEKNIQKTIDYENKKLSFIFFLPLLLIVGFVPFIVYAKLIDLKGTTQALYWTTQGQYLDFFSYWKSMWVIILTGLSSIIYLGLIIDKKLPFKNIKKYYIPLFIYSVLVILSAINSFDKNTALWGFPDMFQGSFVLISYVVLTFLVINYVNSNKDISLFKKAFIILMIAEGVLGISQYFGFDLIRTNIGKALIIPNYLKVDNINFTFGPKTIYATLFNTNFVGSFAALMIPLSLAFLLSSKNKNQKIISIISVVLMLFVWIGSNSRAGYVGVAVASVIGIWIFRDKIKENFKVFVLSVLILLISVIALNIYTGGNIFNRIAQIKVTNDTANTNIESIKPTVFEDIEVNKNTFYIKTSTETLYFKLEGDKLFFLDENNKELSISTQNNVILINDEKYKEYVISIAQGYPGVTVNRSNINLRFYFTKDGIKFIGNGGRLTEPILPEVFKPLEGLEKLGSMRGYIFGRTIPLLKNYIFVGAGPDNYPFVFPQDDVVGKIKAYDTADIIVDKPHNLYLQKAINTGVLSLLALLALWGMYIFNSLKIYSRMTFDSLDKYVGAACVVSVIGYLIAGLFNDNIVSVTPLFWVILGLGISINHKLEKKIN